MDVDTHVSDKEVSTTALVNNVFVKEERTDTNAKDTERIKIGSNKICIPEDLAKVKKVFFQNRAKLSSRWVTWNSLNCGHPEFNAHHVYTTFLKGQIFAHAGSTSDTTWI